MDTLRRILLAGSAEYFTADSPGGDIIDGVSPPGGQVDAIRCGHLIPSHGWFLVGKFGHYCNEVCVRGI